MKFILILWLASGAVTTAEFKTIEKCANAGAVAQHQFGNETKFMCVEK